MKRAVVAVAVGMLVLAGCGSRPGTDVAPEAPSPSSSASPVVSAQEAAAKQALAEHDRLFPQVAAGCATASPSAEPSASRSLDPEAQRYADNHVFKSTVKMTSEVSCRGNAHSARIAAALTQRAAKAPLTAEDVHEALQTLGYPNEERLGNSAFTFLVPGVGPCITGQVGPPVRVKAHGVYMEGGCKEPRGGH